MSSSWERQLGEQIGYGLAAVILGPHAALQRRARRAMRTAMLDFCRELQPVKLEAPRGAIRRRAQLPGSGGTLSVELHLDLNARTARLALPLDRLPGYVNARVTKSVRSLGIGIKPEREEPQAVAGRFGLETASLDGEAARALVEMIASGPLDRIDALDLSLSPEQIDLLVVAPATIEGWATISHGVIGVVAWLTARWPASYR